MFSIQKCSRNTEEVPLFPSKVPSGGKLFGIDSLSPRTAFLPQHSFSHFNNMACILLGLKTTALRESILLLTTYIYWKGCLSRELKCFLVRNRTVRKRLSLGGGGDMHLPIVKEELAEEMVKV